MTIENHETFGGASRPAGNLGFTGAGDPRDRPVLDPETLAVDVDEAKRLAKEADLEEPAPAEAYDPDENPDLGDAEDGEAEDTDAQE